MVLLVFCTGAAAQQCANPKALGVSRVLPIDPRSRPLVGSFDYGISLPLAPREVVLTFDDGPRPPYTNRVLKALADECVRATFFVLGRQALAFPAMVRQLHGAGHTIGTHTQNHPMHRMSQARAVQSRSKRALSRSPARSVHGRPSRRFSAFRVFIAPAPWKPICARAV